MTSRSALDTRYFEDIVANDDDPWNIASSEYQAKIFAVTHDAPTGRCYARALGIGCPHGALTKKIVGLCDSLLAVEISTKALAKARARVCDRPGLELAQTAFAKETPAGPPCDLMILSEVVYDWGVVDLDRASEWLRDAVASDGRSLVHYTGKAEYPHSADQAIVTLWSDRQADFAVERTERHEGYRLNLWQRR